VDVAFKVCIALEKRVRSKWPLTDGKNIRENKLYNSTDCVYLITAFVKTKYN
jgi:hypothetical protein